MRARGGNAVVRTDAETSVLASRRMGEERASTRGLVKKGKKGILPNVSAHVRRGALLQALDRARARGPLTWVTGLPGSGKTSLVTRWVEELGVPFVWCRMREHDDDVAALFDEIVRQHPNPESLPVWSPDHQADLEAFAVRFFGAMAETELVVVIDDCHRSRDDGPTLSLFEHVREVASTRLHMILVSRRAPPAFLARGHVGGWLTILDDLRLSADETLLVARSARGDEISKKDAVELHRADGWLAHVLALAHSPLRKDVGPISSADLGEFLGAELLASVSRPHRDALRWLGELPEIPRTGPNDLFAPELVRLLEGLAAQRYFVEIVVDDRGEERFRFHDLLRDALRARNARSESPSSLSGVRRRLADWVSVEMPEAALRLRAAAGDTAGVVALLERHASGWFARGLHRSVLEWLRVLPDDPETASAIAYFRALASLPIEPEAARPLFATARRDAVGRRDSLRAYGAWCGEVGSFVVQWGAVHGLAALVDELELLEAELGPPPPDLAFRTSAQALTALMYGRAEDPRIGRYAEATATAIAHASDAGARIEAAAQLLIYRLWWAGDFPGGKALYESFDEEVSRGEGLDPLPRLVWWSCASIIDWQCGDPLACYSKVERGLELAEASGVHVRDFFLLTQGIFCALSQEDWPRAERYLGRLSRTERTHKRLDAMVHHFFRSWYSLCRGDARTALAHARTAWPMAEAMGSTFHKVIVLSALAPACVHVGELEEAESAYRMQIDLAKAARNPTFSFIAFCAGAEIAMARNDEAALRKQVERMLVVKELGGFHTGCGWRTPMMRKVLDFALRSDIWPEVAKQWIREKRISPPEPAPPGWPSSVHIQGKKGLHVDVSGSLAEQEGAAKSARKLREVLAVLVAKKEGASQDDLASWVWPDSEGDKAAASLKVAVHRLRKWLGADSVLVRGGHVRLNDSRVDCDLWRPETIRDLEPNQVLAGYDSPPVTFLRKRIARARERGD